MKGRLDTYCVYTYRRADNAVLEGIACLGWEEVIRREKKHENCEKKLLNQEGVDKV